MAPTFTPGPWETDPTGRYYEGHVIRHNGMVVCRVLDLGFESHGNREANARLIAASPELFAALERATELLLPTNEHESAEYSSWLALLARVQGEG